MSKYPKSPIETSAGDRLRAAFDKPHFTMPLDALEASEIAEHILEAIDAWSTAGFGAITADEIREAIKLRVTSGSTRISAMTLDQLRGEVLERMRSIAQEIGSESIGDTADWERLKSGMVLLDAARMSLEMTLKFMCQAQAATAKPQTEKKS